METKFNFDVSAKVVESTGKVLLYTTLYVVECVHYGSPHFNLGYYFQLDDAEQAKRVYSDMDGYADIIIISRTLFL